MLDVDLLYVLQNDPDGYWILYDLCLENNWAFVYLQPIMPTFISHNPYSRIRYCSQSGYNGWSETSYLRCSVAGLRYLWASSSSQIVRSSVGR
jgi:hypothetical protein